MILDRFWDRLGVLRDVVVTVLASLQDLSEMFLGSVQLGSFWFSWGLVWDRFGIYVRWSNHRFGMVRVLF